MNKTTELVQTNLQSFISIQVVISTLSSKAPILKVNTKILENSSKQDTVKLTSILLFIHLYLEFTLDSPQTLLIFNYCTKVYLKYLHKIFMLNVENTQQPIQKYSFLK